MTARRSLKGKVHPRGQPDADALIRRATGWPEIREVMRVYEDWKRADRGMEWYRGDTTWVGTWVDRNTSGSGT